MLPSLPAYISRISRTRDAVFSWRVMPAVSPTVSIAENTSMSTCWSVNSGCMAQIASVAIAPSARYTTTMEQARRSRSFSIRLPKMCTSSSPLRMETAVSTTSSSVVAFAPPAVEPELPPVSISSSVSMPPAGLSSPVGTVSKPAVRGVTAENRLAQTRVPVVMPAMAAFLSVTKNSAAGTSTRNAVSASTTRVCRRSFFQHRRFLIRSCQTGKPSPATRISVITVRLISGSPAKRSSEENDPLTGPIRSKPALQNADIAWNTLYQSPFAQPSIGTNRNASAAAPSPSMVAVPISASRISRTMPPTLKEATLSCKIVRWRRPIRLPIAMETSASSVITPKPPIWMATISTTCPKSDQCVPVSTSTCPVTQTALVAVNSAVSGGVTVRLCDAIGSMSSSVTSRISSAKPMAIISDGLIGASLFSFILYLPASPTMIRFPLPFVNARRRVLSDALTRLISPSAPRSVLSRAASSPAGRCSSPPTRPERRWSYRESDTARSSRRIPPAC